MARWIAWALWLQACAPAQTATVGVSPDTLVTTDLFGSGATDTNVQIDLGAPADAVQDAGPGLDAGASVDAGSQSDPGQVSDPGPQPGSDTVPDSAPDAATLPDSAPTPDAAAGPDAAPTPDTAAGPDAAPTPDTAAGPDAAPTPDAASLPDLDPGPDAAPPAVCLDAPVPAAVAASPLPTQVPSGKVETAKTGNFVDDYLYQGDGALKIGIRQDWGAAIVFFGMTQAPGLNASNVIDANDTGREVQVALYDAARAMQGCAWNASCTSNPQSACPGSITYLGWNPVQGGNECNIGSPIESAGGAAGVLTAVVRPNHWNPDWQEAQCLNTGCSDPVKKVLKSDVRYTQKLRFVQNNVVEVDMQVDNLSAMDHAATLQEFPTLYASYGAAGTPNLKVLLDSSGQAIAIDQPANDGFFVKNFASPGGWATLQNANQDYGVALYYENRLSAFQGWQKAGVFNNFRSQFPFGLPGNGTVRARAYLVIGSFATVKALITGLDAKIPAFGALDTPAAEAQVGPSVQLTGWVLDNVAVNQVTAQLDGQPWAPLALDVARPDVCATWPGYAMCQGKVGFSHALALPAGLGACGHLLEVVATDSHGNSRVIGRTRIFTGGAQAPVPPPPPVPAHHPVWRFTASTSGVVDHMFGLGQTAAAGYATEGLAFDLFDGPGTPAAPIVPIYQRYCAACTDHMPSLDAAEGAPDYTGGDVLGFCSPQPTTWAPTKLTRLYSASATDHFLTSSAAEVQSSAGIGYAAEWSCWGP